MSFEDGTNFEKQGLTELETRKLATRVDETFSSVYSDIADLATINISTLSIDLSAGTALSTLILSHNELALKLDSIIEAMEDSGLMETE